MRPRVILTSTAEAADASKFIWDRIKQAELFGAGPIAVQLGFFGREDEGQVRPYLATRWAVNADELSALVDHAQTRCVCGCFTTTDSILESALRETCQGPVAAVVIVGDSFHGDLDAAIATAEKLRAAGTRVFLFQQSVTNAAEPAIARIAEMTGGAFFQFNPHVEKLSGRLIEQLAAITHFAVGGKDALEALDNESAVLLLERMNTADRALVGGN